MDGLCKCVVDLMVDNCIIGDFIFRIFIILKICIGKKEK